MSSYNESAMRARINDCLKTVAVVLDANKSNSLAAADVVVHRYEDKYLLANQLTNTSISTISNALGLIGVSSSTLQTLRGWNVNKAVSLRFERKQRCKFIREVEREVEDPTRLQMDGLHQTTVKMITKVKEYIYQVKEKYTLFAFSGVGDNSEKTIKITSESGQMEAICRNKCAPFQESAREVFDVNISWLLKHINEAGGAPNFSIDRAHPNCATPRQNPDVIAA